MLDKVSKEDIKKFQSLKGVIENLQKTMEQYSDYLSENETRTRQFLIDPLLRELDWDVLNPDSVQLEYSVKSGSSTKWLDYVLARDDWCIAVVEAKRLNCNPNWAKEAKERKNILDNDPIKEDIHYIIVTDGNMWQIYDASEVGLKMAFELYNEPADVITLQVLEIWRWRWQSNSAFPIDKIKDDSAVLPPIKQLYLEYWQELKNNHDRRLRASGIKFRTPQPQCFMTFAIGGGGFVPHYWVSRDKNYICVGLTVRGTHGRFHFNRLKESMIEIQKKIGVTKLEWQENPKENNIRLYWSNINLEDRRDWIQQHQWLCDKLELFYEVFKPRIDALKTETKGL